MNISVFVEEEEEDLSPLPDVVFTSDEVDGDCPVQAEDEQEQKQDQRQGVSYQINMDEDDAGDDVDRNDDYNDDDSNCDDIAEVEDDICNGEGMN